MVHSSQARADIDNFCLTKVIKLKIFDTTTKHDLAYETMNRVGTFSAEYNVKAQVTITNISHRWVKQGILAEGDALALFRYEYSEDADGNPINPTVVPKMDDQFVFLGRTFIIKAITPATSEDDAIIGWDIRGTWQK